MPVKRENPQPVLQSATAYQWINPNEIDKFAFPAGPRKLLEYLRTEQPERLHFSSKPRSLIRHIDKLNGAVVRAEYFMEDGGTFYPIFGCFTHTKIINTPADILGAGTETITPPGILLRFLVVNAKGIDISCRDKAVHPRPFFRGETGILDIIFGIF